MNQTNTSDHDIPFRILVADDDDLTRTLLCHQLRSRGHDVAEAADGADALFMLYSDPTIRMALLDWHMPGGPDEYDLCEKVRYIGHATYIIIITAEEDNSTTASALNAGAHDYIIKPWNKDDLLARVGVGCRIIAMQDQLKLQATALKTVANAIMIADAEGCVQWINPAYTRLTGYAIDEIKGQPSPTLQRSRYGDDPHGDLWKTITSGRSWHGEIPAQRKDGEEYTEEITITPVQRDGKIIHYISVKQDITKRKALEGQLLHAQKMESIGQLAAGIAHEINTPIQYVGDNTRFVRDSIVTMLKVVESYSAQLDPDAERRSWSERAAEIKRLVDDVDLDFLIEEIPLAIEQTLDGVDRVANIVRAMKDFSHPGGDEKAPTDLNRTIESTIAVCRNRWKYVADLETDFEENLPPTPCFVGEFNQVILNIVVNAADAISEALDVARDVDGESDRKGTITVSTRSDGTHVEIRVSDTGGGVPDNIRQKIFDPFFTTKEPGKGTGQGLAISHDVIVNKHGGTIDIEVDPGVGTTFVIRMPISDQAESRQMEAA